MLHQNLANVNKKKIEKKVQKIYRTAERIDPALMLRYTDIDSH